MGRSFDHDASTNGSAASSARRFDERLSPQPHARAAALEEAAIELGGLLHPGKMVPLDGERDYWKTVGLRVNRFSPSLLGGVQDGSGTAWPAEHIKVQIDLLWNGKEPHRGPQRRDEADQLEGEDGIGDAIGPFYRAEALAERLGVDENGLRLRSALGEYLRLKTSDGVDVWPAMQFDENLEAPRGLRDVVSALNQLYRNDDGWTAAFWLTGRSDPSDPDSPTRMSMLRTDGPAPLLALIGQMQAEKNEHAKATLLEALHQYIETVDDGAPSHDRSVGDASTFGSWLRGEPK